MERFLVEESENEGVGWRESQGGRAIGSLSFPFCHVKNSAEQPAGPVLHTESISMQSSAETVAQYLQELPADRREFMETLRQVIADSIDPRFVETMQYGMITWVIPKDIYPPGYHCKPNTTSGCWRREKSPRRRGSRRVCQLSVFSFQFSVGGAGRRRRRGPGRGGPGRGEAWRGGPGRAGPGRAEYRGGCRGSA